jgi:hypothetical protein
MGSSKAFFHSILSPLVRLRLCIAGTIWIKFGFSPTTNTQNLMELDELVRSDTLDLCILASAPSAEALLLYR